MAAAEEQRTRGHLAGELEEGDDGAGEGDAAWSCQQLAQRVKVQVRNAGGGS